MIPALLGSMHLALKESLTNHYPLDRIEPGDVLLMNHPYLGGTHTPDIAVFRPSSGRARWSHSRAASLITSI